MSGDTVQNSIQNSAVPPRFLSALDRLARSYIGIYEKYVNPTIEFPFLFFSRVQTFFRLAHGTDLDTSRIDLERNEEIGDGTGSGERQIEGIADDKTPDDEQAPFRSTAGQGQETSQESGRDRGVTGNWFRCGMPANDDPLRFGTDDASDHLERPFQFLTHCRVKAGKAGVR